MNDDVSISVVIPARNAASTLGEAIASLQVQTFRHWQAIVIDDCSADATAELARSMAERDPRITVVEGPGRGASAARNCGIAQARGRWLQFLDADDWLEPDHFARMMRALQMKPAATGVWCSYRRIMPDGQPDLVKVPLSAGEPAALLGEYCIFAIHGVIVERQLVQQLGGFDETLATCEDWDLWQRVARSGVVWAAVPELVVPYRASAGSLSNRSESLLRDGLTVIARGLQGESVSGTPAAELAHRQGRFALWVLCVQAAAGKPPVIDRSVLGNLPADPHRARDLADWIFDGLVVGLQTPRDRPLLAWDRLKPALDGVLDILAGLIDEPADLRRIEYLVDDVFLQGQWRDGTVLRRTLLVERGDIGDETIALPAGIDRVHYRLVAGGRAYASVTIAALGALDEHDIRNALAASNPLGGMGAAKLRARLLSVMPGPLKRRLRGLRGARGLSVVRRGVAVLAAIRPRRAQAQPESPTRHSAHRGALAEMSSRPAVTYPPRIQPVDPASAGTSAGHEDHWEQVFAVEDPWDYDSAYEAEKYDRQIAMLPSRPIGNALELACAEGHFTRRLASKCEHLLAADISATALDRNRKHHDGLGNVDFARLDLRSDPIPSGQDLIVCSEVLYYLGGLSELRAVAGKLADALAPGGCLLAAHAYLITDDRTRTGFDWGFPFGAQAIADALRATPGLALEATMQTELYRIDRYRKLAPGEPAPHPVAEHAGSTAPLTPAVERLLIRGGAAALRSELAGRQSDRVPVLMYHGVADDGPEALARWRVSPGRFLEQVRWLRRNGYHTLSPAEFAAALERNRPFAGRPVVITFDDGQQSFADHAWPILRAHDFSAEMFLVTGAVGRSADWDGDAGRQVPLMDTATIQRLAGEGVRFGSHFTRHVPANGLASHELAAELIGSRLAIESWLGDAPVQLAAPYTIPDPRFAALARSCGYALLYGNRSGPAARGDPPLDLPRIEVEGSWSLDRFVAVMEGVQ